MVKICKSSFSRVDKSDNTLQRRRRPDDRRTRNFRPNANFRRGFVALVFAFFCLVDASALWAQQSQWALKMFSEMGGERVHDFGSVALHAEVEHRFQFKNIYREDVVITSVASNCGCTKATATKQVIRSNEIGEIVARVDTSGREHTKNRKATITVIFSKPTFAEVQLQIKTYIRSDVGFDPGSIEFGTVPQGKSVVKKAYLQYEGRSDWALIGIQKSNPGIRAEAREVRRQGGSVVYEILVELKSDAAPGYVRDLLKFKTNDPDVATSSVFLPLQALVTAPLTAKPSFLQFGVVEKNQTTTKNLVVSGSTPFKILRVGSNDPRLSFLKTDLTRTVHVIPVTFTADDRTGVISQSIFIATSQPNQNQLYVATTGFVVDDEAAVDAAVSTDALPTDALPTDVESRRLPDDDPNEAPLSLLPILSTEEPKIETSIERSDESPNVDGSAAPQNPETIWRPASAAPKREASAAPRPLAILDATFESATSDANSSNSDADFESNLSTSFNTQSGFALEIEKAFFVAPTFVETGAENDQLAVVETESVEHAPSPNSPNDEPLVGFQISRRVRPTSSVVFASAATPRPRADRIPNATIPAPSQNQNSVAISAPISNSNPDLVSANEAATPPRLKNSFGVLRSFDVGATAKTPVETPISATAPRRSTPETAENPRVVPMFSEFETPPAPPRSRSTASPRDRLPATISGSSTAASIKKKY